MQRNLIKCLLLLIVVLMGGELFAQAQRAVSPKAGVVRVKLQPQVAAKLQNGAAVKTQKGIAVTGVEALDRTAQEMRVTSIKRLFPYSPRFEERHKAAGLDLWYEIEFDTSIDANTARQRFSNTAGVKMAENVLPKSLKDGSGKPVSIKALGIDPTVRTSSNAPFNDPMLGQQWHYFNDGSVTGSVAGADINLFEAWQSVTGRNDVVVAIVDGGIDYTHPDLADNMWVNEAELNGLPGVDDDGNGYTDDIYGYNFVVKSGDISGHYHGTHVAGTIGAVNNNGIGVAGVAGGDGSGNGVKLMSCQIFETRTGTSQSDGYAEAIVYAADMGASIVNCSWGYNQEGIYEQAVLDAIDYFTQYGGGDNMSGGLCIFASGNDGMQGQIYPGCYEPVVAVAAMTCDMKTASYSNCGPWVDVTAPGGDISLRTSNGVLSTAPDNDYAFMEGTSMACPHVTGIAALVLSRYGSENFPVETLRSQLVNSVRDLYSNNPGAEGLFGLGYIDAARAVNMSESGAAPEAIAAFDLYPAQDNITVEWAIPEVEDGVVMSHNIYYSTSEFTADNLPSTRVVVDTRFYDPGYQMSYVIEGLQAETTYYVAIQAVGRSGATSALSPVKSATTNSGPAMSIDKTTLYITATPDVATPGQFTISNNAEGLLRWSATTRTQRVSLSTRSLGGNTLPASPGAVAQFDGRLQCKPVPASNEYVRSDEYLAGDYPKSFTYSDHIQAYIGETDTSLPNSLAQLFTVDAATYPDGFNLTHLYFGGASDATDPEIKIYRGGTISEENLLLDVDYSWFTYNYNIQLNEQLFFEPGEQFWVVAHFNAGYTNPLGLGYNDAGGLGSISYMSFDKGQTWILLREALVGSSYETLEDHAVWDVKAVSQNPDWSQLMKLEPSSGTVPGNSTQLVTVTTDGQPMINGSYNFNIYFETNENDDNTIKLPVTFNVSGQQPQLSTAKIVRFGDLRVGETASIDVEVVNSGYGGFFGSSGSLYSQNIKCDNENFSVPTYISGFAARSTSRLTVTFAPVTAGSHTGTVTLTDKNGNTHQFTVFGSATDPAKIAIEPSEIEVGDLELGTTLTQSFTITNEGNYPLEYMFPRFSDDTIEGVEADQHSYGYTYTSNIDGATDFEYDGNPALVNATEITSTFSDTDVWSDPIQLGFSFPYYGQSYDRVYISSFGGIAMSNSGDATLRSPLTATSTSIGGYGFIMAYGRQLMMGPNSKVEYARQDGRFVVNFSNVMAVVYDQDYTPISFHIALSPNGDIEIFYDDYTPSMVFNEGADLFVGVNDLEVADPFTITSADIADQWYDTETTPEGQLHKSIVTGTAIRISAPSGYFITALDRTSGTLAPNASATITATLEANESLNAGTNANRLVVMSNDPQNTTSFVTFTANVTGDFYQAAASLASETVDFGQVFRTSTAVQPVTVTNSGQNVLTVTSATVAGGKFAIDPSLSFPFTLQAGYSRDINVTLPTEQEGAVEDVITIATDKGELTAQLTGEVIGCPEIATDVEQMSATVDYGAAQSASLTISNQGNEPLEYSLDYNTLLTLTGRTQEVADVEYQYRASVDYDDVTYEWIDIETTGVATKLDVFYLASHDYVAVDLPFTFEYYGIGYDRMYIYNAGFVSFTERPDEAIWPTPPETFPGGTIFNNIIAPFWGNHSPGSDSASGLYYYADTANSRFIVSFMGYGNSMNSGVCFQLILNADGSFKFQYKGLNAYSVLYTMFGYAGISNVGATEGFAIPERTVQFNQAVEFVRTETVSIPAGESDQLTFDYNTTQMAGQYSEDLVIRTNQPGSPAVSIPVSLTINGTAQPVFPESVGGEFIVGATTPDGPMGQGYYLELPFEVKNAGSAGYTISSINMTLDNPEAQYYVMLYYYGTYYDWFGNPTVGWSQYDPYFSGPITAGLDPVKFNIAVVDNYTPATYNGNIAFVIDGVEGMTTVNVPVSITITPAPVVSVDRQEVTIYCPSDDATTETVTITNAGEYALNYTLEVAPLYGEQFDNTTDDTAGGDDLGGGGIAPMSVKAAALPDSATVYDDGKIVLMDNTSDSPYDVPTDGFEYLDALYYPAVSTPSAYGYGSFTTTSTYRAATCFEAPAGGFNLSHIYTSFNFGTLTNMEITYKVVAGSDPDGDIILGRGSYEVAEMIYGGTYFELASMPLDEPVYLGAGQEFCVVVTYPAGYEAPTLVITKSDDYVAGRYMGQIGDGQWGDVSDVLANYGNLGYVMTCLETTEGQSWVRILEPTDAAGTVAVGQSSVVKLGFDPTLAPIDRGNTAVLAISSNDPSTPVKRVRITLDKNAAPEITTPDYIVAVDEASTIDVEIPVMEYDGEAMTVTLTDEDEIATIKAATSGTVEGNTVSVEASTEGSTITVTLAPQYGDAGSHEFHITAADANGNTASAAVAYEVAHVNRAPEAVECADIEIAEGATSPVVYFASLFTDPDGDEMTYAMTISNTRTVTAYTATDGSAMFYGNAVGEVTVTVTATDENGATATNSFKVIVKESSGIDQVIATTGMALYPNPVESQATVVCGSMTGQITYSIYSDNGALMIEDQASHTAGEPHIIDVASLPSGVYVLKVTNKATEKTALLIKK